MTQANKATQRMVAVDIAAVNLPPVSLDEGPAIETESGDDIEAELKPFDDATQGKEILDSIMDEPCDSFPGEQC